MFIPKPFKCSPALDKPEGQQSFEDQILGIQIWRCRFIYVQIHMSPGTTSMWPSNKLKGTSALTWRASQTFGCCGRPCIPSLSTRRKWQLGLLLHKIFHHNANDHLSKWLELFAAFLYTGPMKTSMVNCFCTHHQSL